MLAGVDSACTAQQRVIPRSTRRHPNGWEDPGLQWIQTGSPTANVQALRFGTRHHLRKKHKLVVLEQLQGCVQGRGWPDFVYLDLVSDPHGTAHFDVVALRNATHGSGPSRLDAAASREIARIEQAISQGDDRLLVCFILGYVCGSAGSGHGEGPNCSVPAEASVASRSGV